MKTKKLGIAVFTILLIIPLMASINTVSSAGYYNALMAPPGSNIVQILSPSNGETVSGVVLIELSKSADLYIDEVQVASGVSSYNWDTTAYADGSHVIKAQGGRGYDVDQISVTVDNGGSPPVDNPPSVTITSPSNGATVGDVVIIAVSITDEDSLTPDIYINSVYVGTTATYEWDTTTYTDGVYTIYAEATDSASQTGSDEISVTVDNTSPPPEPSGDMPWWNDLINAEVAHANGITGTGSVVVIIDTGLGSNWQDLFPSTNILSSYSMSQTKQLGLDNVDWNQDTEGHGTACTATVIGYNLNLESGTRWVQGVAPDAKIVMIRTVYWISTFGPPHSRVTATDMLNAWADAIYYSIDLANGALSSYNMVVSMSLGYSSTNSYLTGAIQAAESAGIVIASSAGNDGHTSSTTGYVANYAEVTSVAAAGWDSLTGQYSIDELFTDIPEGDFSGLIIADFSSGGKVDVTGIGYNLILPMTDGYYYISGTSFSCPQTAGVYALMFQAHGSKSVAWLEDYLKAACYWDGSYMTDFVWGAGFIQACAATS